MHALVSISYRCYYSNEWSLERITKSIFGSCSFMHATGNMKCHINQIFLDHCCSNPYVTPETFSLVSSSVFLSKNRASLPLASSDLLFSSSISSFSLAPPSLFFLYFFLFFSCENSPKGVLSSTSSVFALPKQSSFPFFIFSVFHLTFSPSSLLRFT